MDCQHPDESSGMIQGELWKALDTARFRLAGGWYGAGEIVGDIRRGVPSGLK